MSLNIWKTARKHAKKQRINDDDILQVATFPHWIEPLDEENPQRELRIGFDTKGRVLEVVVLTFDSGNELIIHAMKAREQYLVLLK